MKLLSVSLALAACLSMAAAQGLQDLPPCARQCATGSIPANCGLSVQCICSDSSFISGISCCIRNTCPPDQQQAAVQFANQICRTAGVTNLPQSPSCPSSTGTSSATTSGSSTNTATNESNTTSQTSTASPTAATATTSTTSTTTSSSASAATTTSKGAAVAQHKDIGLLAAAGAAAAAFGLLA